jgi:hypothetical protein
VVVSPSRRGRDEVLKGSAGTGPDSIHTPTFHIPHWELPRTSYPKLKATEPKPTGKRGAKAVPVFPIPDYLVAVVSAPPVNPKPISK